MQPQANVFPVKPLEHRRPGTMQARVNVGRDTIITFQVWHFWQMDLDELT